MKSEQPGRQRSNRAAQGAASSGVVVVGIVLGIVLGCSPGLCGLLGFASSVAVTLDGDDISVMDDAIDESSGAGGVGEDGGPSRRQSALRADDRWKANFDAVRVVRRTLRAGVATAPVSAWVVTTAPSEAANAQAVLARGKRRWMVVMLQRDWDTGTGRS